MLEEQHGNDYVPLRTGPKKERYERVAEELENRLDPNSHPIANTSNLLAILRQQFEWWWLGFYWVTKRDTNQEHMTLLQFQGPPACSKIFKGKGVCGTVWAKGETIILQDVNTFQGHIACSSVSKSQIVIPIFKDQLVIGVLDVDGANYGEFDETDSIELKKLLHKIEEIGQFEWFCKHI